MSDNLYRSRLRFSGHGGIAKLHGVAVHLSDPPNFGIGPVWAVDYVPEVGLAEVQQTALDRWRAMEPDEISAADDLLRRLTDVPAREPEPWQRG